MRTRIFSFLFVLFSLFPAFSAGGVLADSSSPLHVIRTQYFDIIFPEESRGTARKIEEVCDDYYIEICSILETEACQRFPVTITPSVENLNAYYAAVPYNRIVLFDTVPETSLDMYEDTILSVFYHELTHAVTYNMKSDGFKKLSFFADMLTPAWLSITTFWAEGATVSFESKGKGGRLNDPFSTQIVNQAKIEGHFPSWRDVTGTRDTYPGGTDAYMFGSMFAAYLQETYGMRKYAEFWKTAGGKISLGFVAGVFKQTYGKSVTQVWKDFEKTLELEAEKKTVNPLSHKKSRIMSFDVHFDENGGAKIAYFDTASSSLRLLVLDSNGKVKKNRKLLAITGIARVAFSPDGEKLALSRIIDKRTQKSVVAEYDLKSRKYVQYEQEGLREAHFASFDGKTKLHEIVLNDIKNEIPFSPLGIDENLCAKIVKKGLNWKIRLYDSEKTLFDYDFSKFRGILDSENAETDGASNYKNLILHNLHLVSCDSDSIFLSFTWAELGAGGKMLSRAGFLMIDRKTGGASAFLQKKNAFAGMIEAVPSPKSASLFNGKKNADSDSVFPVFAVAAEYEKNPLYCIEMRVSDFERFDLTGENFVAAKNSNASYEETQTAHASESSVIASEAKQSCLHNELSYNPFRYYRRGVILPLATVDIYSHDFDIDSSANLGMTFVSTNPWGDRRIDFSAGYNPSFKNGGMKLGFEGGDDSFAYNLIGTCIFDKNGFMQTFDSLQLTKNLWRGKVSSFTAGTQANFLYGKQICDEDLEEGRDDSVGKSADALAFVQFSNIHKVSPLQFYSAGFSIQPFLLASYRDSENRYFEDKYVNAGTNLTLRFPILVPFIFTASLFPSSKYAAVAGAKAILFDYEIHRGIPAVSLYVQRFVLSAAYSGKIIYLHDDFFDIKKSDEIFKNIEKEDYSDALQFSADFYLSPNTGFLANGDIQFSLGYSVIYRPNPQLKENKIEYGVTVKMNN